MRDVKSKLRGVLLCCAGFLSLASNANALTCRDVPAAGEKVFAVSVGTCVQTGEDNITGYPMPLGKGLFAPDAFIADHPGWVTLDTTGDTSDKDILDGILSITNGTSSGSFSINGGQSVLGYSLFVLLLKDGQDGPVDWGAFLLSALTGDWSIVDENGNDKNLSHAILYSLPGQNNTGVTPVPPALLLFGTGLVGLIALGRRRRGVAAIETESSSN